MNRKLLLIILLYISPNFIISEDVECQNLFNSGADTIFNSYKANQCINLIPSNSQLQCYYDNTGCVPRYKKCEDYVVAAGGTFEDDKCTTIRLDNSKKCKVEDVEGVKTCKEVYKVCEDYNNDKTLKCSNLKINEEGTPDSKKRCALNNKDECDIHYNNCEDIADNTGDACTNNVPSEATKKCNWDDTENKCMSDKRKCNEYGDINKYYGTTTCSALAYGTGKRCILNGETCEEKASCEDYEGNSDEDCKKNTPIDTTKDNLDVSNLYICSINGNQECAKRLRECEEYQNSGGGNNICENLHTFDKNKKVCFLDTSCQEVYIGCALATASNCTDTIPYKIGANNLPIEDVNSECKWTGTTCELKDKDCNKFNENKLLCEAHSFTDSRKDEKKCIYDDSASENKCKEVYKTCEFYNSNTVAEDKNQNDCEEIYQKSEPQECVYIESSKKCETKERECEDGNSSQELCKKLKTTNTTHYCLFKGTECQEHHRECKTTSDRIECESNIPYDNNKECILEYDSECKLTTKQTQTYNYCSDYDGQNEEICGNIIPLTKNGEAYTYSVKCGIKELKCVLMEPECDKIEDKIQCISTKLKDTDKICVYDDDKSKCIEQDKDCNTFEKNKGEDNTKNKEECEALKGQKCKYESNTCSADSVECEDFNPDLLEENKCTILTDSITDKTQKCIYSGTNICSQVPKTCTELSTFPSNVQTDEKESVCTNADVTGTNKNCVVNDNGTGCKLVDKSQNSEENNPKPNNQDAESNGNNDDNNNNNNDSNSARTQFINKILILLLSLLF